MTEYQKITLDAALSVFLRMCEKTDCDHCPLTLFFHRWEICPVEVIAHLLNQEEHPERKFDDCDFVVLGKCMVKQYFGFPCIRETCNCATCETFKPKAAGEA